MARITGTQYDDDDTFLGSVFGGHHYLAGNDGEDNQIYGEGGNDVILGGNRNDYIDGGSGADAMVGFDGNDTYIVDNVDDVVNENGYTGDDEIVALVDYTLSLNVETLTLGATAGAINGNGNELDNELNGNSSANVLDGKSGKDEIFGNGGDDTLFGGEGDDRLFGGAQNDILSGGLNNDTLDGGSGDDQMFGGSGDDVYIVNSSGDVVSEFLGSGYDTVFSSVSFVLPSGIEGLVLEGFANNGTGNALANTIVGNERNNTISGLDGNDELYGLGGNDTIDGGFGDDTMAGGDNTDTLSFTSWDPTVPPSPFSLPESIRIDLTTGTATRTQTNPLTGTSVVETDTFSEFENVRGSNRTETIVGNGGVNVLEGRGGNDTLQGGGGSDTLDGGLGTDTATYENNLGGRVIVTLGLNGADGTASELTVVGQQIVTHTDTLRSIENVRGTNFNDTITGNEADNVIDGRSGSDTMAGRAGNDTYLVDNALDRVIEAAGEGSQDRVRTSVSYTLTNGSEVEVLETTNQSGTAAINLTGNDGVNFIVGNNGANIINGGGNSDRLSGGGGNDTLTGGSGSDAFSFDTALNGATNVDIITDFSVAEVDTILLDDAIFTGLAGTVGNSITLQEFRIGTAAQDADDHIIYNNVTGALLYDADGIGGTAAVQFATLSPGLALTNGLIGII